MLIGLDLLHARPRIGGAWNYIENTLQALGRYGGEHSYVAYCTAHSEPLVPRQDNFAVRRFELDPERTLARAFAECTTLQRAARRDGLDVLHVFSGLLSPWRVCPHIVTFYDFVSEASPASVGGRARRAYFRSMASYALQHADVVAPISGTIAGEVTRRFPAVAARTVVVPMALGEHCRPGEPEQLAAFRAAYGLPDRFWLYVAHYYPHKNHERLFAAYAQLRHRQPDAWPLVLRGNKHGADALLDEMVATAGIADHVCWLPPLSDREMALLYSSATALVYPSLYEGAGLPLVEAMACGCPVVASNIPTTHEFCGDAAEFFEASDIAAIAGAMARLASDERLRCDCAERGLRQAEAHRAERVTAVLAQAYQQAVGAA